MNAAPTAAARPLAPDERHALEALAARMEQSALSVLVGGLRSPDALAILARGRARPDRRSAFYVVEPDPAALATLFATPGARALLEQADVFCFVGPDAVAALERVLAADTAKPVPHAVVTAGPLRPLVGECLARVEETRRSARAGLRQALERAWSEGRERESHAAIAAGEPLRILAIGTRHAPVAAADLLATCEALRELGHDVRLYREPSGVDELDAISLARAAVEHRPHLVFVVNLVRSDLGAMLPATLPIVTWLQDDFPRFFAPPAIAGFGPCDVLLAYSAAELAVYAGYPADRVVPFAPRTREQPFPSEAPAPDGPDAVYVSNESRTADEALATVVAEAQRADESGLLTVALEAAAATILAREAQDQPLALVDEAIDLLEGELLRLRTRCEPMLLRRLGKALFVHVHSVALRQGPLATLAGAGLSLRLYGHGWERHPQLGRFAGGHLDRARGLPDALRRAKLNLCIFPFGAAHARFLDGAAVGTLTLVRHHPCDFLGTRLRELWDELRAEVASGGVDGAFARVRARSDDPLRLRLLRSSEVFFGDGLIAHPQGESGFRRVLAVAPTSKNSLDQMLPPELADRIVWRTRAELVEKASRMLARPDERRALARDVHSHLFPRYGYGAAAREALHIAASVMRRHLNGGGPQPSGWRLARRSPGSFGGAGDHHSEST